jgi:hypothetical protein
MMAVRSCCAKPDNAYKKTSPEVEYHMYSRRYSYKIVECFGSNMHVALSLYCAVHPCLRVSRYSGLNAVALHQPCTSQFTLIHNYPSESGAPAD